MLLDVRNLEISILSPAGPLPAVNGISFQLRVGKSLGLVGESGCGKTVTALSIMRLAPNPPVHIDRGEIFFNGVDLLSLSPEELRKRRGKDIGMIFQEPMTALNPVFTIGTQIQETLILHRPELSSSERHSRCIELLECVGMSDAKARLLSYPHELSGGMRQRAMIAMALACEPQLLIADEPTTALDVTIQAQVLTLISRLQSERQMGLLLITHDLGVVAESVDHVLVLYAGKSVERAPTDKLFSSPKHPYTKALLEALPSRSQGRKRLTSIEGTVPALGKLPQGCAFQERCPAVQPQCRIQDPIWREIETEHWVSCFEV